jgi:hypothetical protein
MASFADIGWDFKRISAGAISDKDEVLFGYCGFGEDVCIFLFLLRRGINFFDKS